MWRVGVEVFDTAMAREPGRAPSAPVRERPGRTGDGAGGSLLGTERQKWGVGA